MLLGQVVKEIPEVDLIRHVERDTCLYVHSKMAFT